MQAATPPRRVVLAGASGLIGRAVTRLLRARGDDVVTLVRRVPRSPGEFAWDPEAGDLDPAALDGADAVIGLSGASVGRIPWTRGYRRTLVDSRVGPTRLFAETMGRMARPPRVFVSGSAVGVYGDRPGEELDDDSPAGEGFFPDLVTAWEQASRLAPDAVRVVNPRTAVVVAKDGGLAPVRLLTAVGLGSRFGSGRQHWPWISLADEARGILHLLDSELAGPVVLAGPEPATADEVTRAFADEMRRWRPWPIPKGLVTGLLGEAGQRLLFDDMRVVPRRLAADGFVWRHRTVRDAVAAALSDDPLADA